MSNSRTVNYMNKCYRLLEDEDAKELISRIYKMDNLQVVESYGDINWLVPSLYISNHKTKLKLDGNVYESPEFIAHHLKNTNRIVQVHIHLPNYVRSQVVTHGMDIDFEPEYPELFEQLHAFNKQNLIDAALDQRNYKLVEELGAL